MTLSARGAAMHTELETGGVVGEQVQGQMDLLESKIAGVVATISRLKSENAQLAEERDALAQTVRENQDKLAAADTERLQTELGALKKEIELLHRERENIASRIAELLDKLDLLST
jgi:chromosome segregation ATPase